MSGVGFRVYVISMCMAVAYILWPPGILDLPPSPKISDNVGAVGAGLTVSGSLHIAVGFGGISS